MIGSARRIAFLEAPFAVYVTACLVANLIAASSAVHKYTVAVDDYLSATAVIPTGTSFIRLRYPTPDVPAKYGFHEIARDPLFHLDAYAALQCGCLDLSDYQAPSRIFPVVFRSDVPRNLQYDLWSLEGPGDSTAGILTDLRQGLPLPIDHVIVVEDASSTDAGLEKVHQILDSGMKMIVNAPLLRIYQRTASR